MAKSGFTDPNGAASAAIGANLGPDKLAGYNRFTAAMAEGPRGKDTINADAALGNYDKSAENLDLDRTNKVDIQGMKSQTATTNMDRRMSSAEKIAGYRAQVQAWINGGKPMPVSVDGQPSYVRANDPRLGGEVPPMPTMDGAPPAAAPAFGQKIAMAESGGNPTAQNPNSSATGTGQFIDSTWLDMIHKHAPELAQGRTVQQVLDLRKDPELSQVMTNKYGDDNGAILGSQGLPVTDGTKHLAHVLGPGDAMKALKADPRMPLADLVDPSVIRANPMFARMTAGDVVNWANKGFGGAPAAVGQAPVVTGAPGKVGLDPIGDKQDAPYGASDLAAATAAPQAPAAHVVAPLIHGGAAPKTTPQIINAEYGAQKNPDGTLAHPEFAAAMDPHGDKIQQKLEQQFRPVVAKELSSRSGGMGLQDANVNRALHLRALIDQYKQTDDQGNVTYNIPTSQYHELAMGLAALVSGNGTTSDNDRKEIDAKTAASDYNGLLQYVTGSPQSGNSQEMIKNLVDSIDRQGTVAEQEREKYLGLIKRMAPTDLDPKRRDALLGEGLNYYTKRPGAAPQAGAGAPAHAGMDPAVAAALALYK